MGETCKHLKGFIWEKYESPEREKWTPLIREIQELHQTYPELALGNRVFLSRTTYPECPQLAELQEVLAWCGFQVVNPYHFRKLGRTETEWDFLKDILLRCDYFVALLDCFGGGQREKAKVDADEREDLTYYDSNTVRFPSQTICQWEFIQAYRLRENSGSPAIISFVTKSDCHSEAVEGVDSLIRNHRFRPVADDPSKKSPSKPNENPEPNDELIRSHELTCQSQAEAITAIKQLESVQAGEWDNHLILSVLHSLRLEMRARAEFVHVRFGDDFRKEWREIHREFDLQSGDRRPLVAICGNAIEHVRPSVEMARFLPAEHYRTVTLNLPNQIHEALAHDVAQVREAGNVLRRMTVAISRLNLPASLPGIQITPPEGNQESGLKNLLDGLKVPLFGTEAQGKRVLELAERLETKLGQQKDLLGECWRKFSSNLESHVLDGNRQAQKLRFLRVIRGELGNGDAGHFESVDAVVAAFFIRQLALSENDTPEDRSRKCAEARVSNAIEAICSSVTSKGTVVALLLSETLDRSALEQKYDDLHSKVIPVLMKVPNGWDAFATILQACERFVAMNLRPFSDSVPLEDLRSILEHLRKNWLPYHAANVIRERCRRAEFQLWMISEKNSGGEEGLHKMAFRGIVEDQIAESPENDGKARSKIFVSIASTLERHLKIAATDLLEEQIVGVSSLSSIRNHTSKLPHQHRHVARRRLPEECLAMLLAARRQELLDSKREMESNRRMRSERYFWYILGGTFILFSLLQFLLQPELKPEDAWRGYLPLGLALLGLVSLIVGFVIERRSDTPG